MLIPEISIFVFRTDSTLPRLVLGGLEPAVMNNLNQKRSLSLPREYLMIYRELGFLAIIWLGSSHIPSPPFPGVSKLPLVFSLPVTCVSPIELTDERWGGGDGEDPNHTTARKLVLYKSFNTLWLQDSITGMYTWEYNWSLGQGPARTLILMV